MPVTWSRRRKITVLTTGILTIVLVVGLLLTGHRSAPRRRASSAASATTTSARESPSPTATTSDAPPTTATPHLPALVQTNDPVQYATAVATALFGVDVSAISRAQFLQFWNSELPTVVYADGAANGLTLAVQNADAINNLSQSWIPSAAVWQEEARTRTVNTVRITSVSVPDFWGTAVANGTFTDPGLRMERVMGVVSQTSLSGAGRRVRTTRPVVIDLGLLCAPTQPGGCRLLAPQQPDGAATTQSSR